MRNFVFKMDEALPYWFYFLSKNDLALQALILCFMPPYLTEEAKAQIFPERLQPLLLERWFPAMNHICEFVEMPEEEIERLTNRVMSYVAKGDYRTSKELRLRTPILVPIKLPGPCDFS